MAAPTPEESFPRRGEIYFANLGPPAGSRPVLVISADALNRHALDVCVVPLTTRQRPAFRLRVRLPRGTAGLKRDSWAKCDQVTTIPKDLLGPRPAGRLGAEKLGEIEAAIELALGLLKPEQR